jgi:Transposase DDE domain
LVCNDQGELLNVAVTPGNTDDRKPGLSLLKGLSGKVLADRGYISHALFETLLTQMGIQFITKPKRNMQNKLMPLIDKLLTRKRSIIGTIIDQLKH